MSDAWEGIFAVLQTPLTDSGELDPESMEKQVGFCIECNYAYPEMRDERLFLHFWGGLRSPAIASRSLVLVLEGWVMACVSALLRAVRAVWLHCRPRRLLVVRRGAGPSPHQAFRLSAWWVRCRCLCLRLLGRWPNPCIPPVLALPGAPHSCQVLPRKREVSSEQNPSMPLA